MTIGDTMRKQLGQLPKKNTDKYPRVCFRIDAALLGRVDALRGKTRLSYGQIIGQSLRKHLPELEKFHAV